MSAIQDWIRLVNTFGVFTGRCFAFICPSDEFEEGGANFLRIYWVLPFQERRGGRGPLRALLGVHSESE